MKKLIRVPTLTRPMQMLAVFLVAGVALLITLPKLEAAPFSVTKIIIEINGTAGDAGIQIFVDTHGWTRLEVFDPNGQKVFDGSAQGSIEQQGVSEFFFESSEPPFSELPLADFLLRFPKGSYTFVGMTDTGQTLTGKATLSHSIPNIPVITSPAEGATLNANLPVVIGWQSVNSPFPGTTDAVKIAGYQVIVSQVKPQPFREFSVFLPPTATQVSVSPQFLQGNAQYGIEVLAIDAGGNQTIAEGSFKTQ